MPNKTIEGGCFCGQVRYKIEGEPVGMGRCHCRDCQQATGSAYTPFIVVEPSSFDHTGECKEFESVGSSGKPIVRSFCKNCGSLLFARLDVLEGCRSVSAATLDDPTYFKPTIDIWLSQAQPWDVIDPNTAHFEKNPSSD